MKHSTDRRTPQELNAANREILKANESETYYNRLATNMWHESAEWPDGSRTFFRGVLRVIHHNNVDNEYSVESLVWPEGMATFERNIMADKFQRVSKARKAMLRYAS